MTFHAQLICLCVLLNFLSDTVTLFAENPIYKKLLGEGIVLQVKEIQKLPEPLLADGLDGDTQRKTIEKLIADKYTWDNFKRHAVVAPFYLTISDPQVDKQNLGRRVDLCFVAYGDLKVLGSDSFANGQLKDTDTSSEANNASQAKLLTDKELERRNLPVPKLPEDPRYVVMEMTLFDKVRISGVTQSIKTETNESVLIASIIDNRFDGDKHWPNQWRSITRDEAGQKKLGEPQKYSGLASYVKVTRLVEPAGALFAEYHIVFAEPQGWFNGANLLRSKLPIVAQDGVRKFRRNLEQEKPKK